MHRAFNALRALAGAPDAATLSAASVETRPGHPLFGAPVFSFATAGESSPAVSAAAQPHRHRASEGHASPSRLERIDSGGQLPTPRLSLDDSPV